jgi:hypothetical protein
MYISERW